MKRILSIALVIIGLSIATNSRADIFSPVGGPQREKVSQSLAIPGVDPGTILADVTQISGYLGVREGYFYDINQHEFANYAAATIVTFAQYGISVDFGALNADGVAASIDWNAGAFVPTQNVPLLSMFQYFYVGFGIAERYTDIGDGNGSQWRFGFGPTGEFKFTF